MKFHKISIVGFSLGALWGIANFWRYYVVSLDTSEMLRGVLEGVVICAFAYIYNWMKNKDLDDDNRDNRINGILKIYGGKEFQDIEVQEFKNGI